MLVNRESLQRRKQLGEQPRSCQGAGSSPRKSCISAVPASCARFRSVRIGIFLRRPPSLPECPPPGSAHLFRVCWAPGAAVVPGETMPNKVDAPLPSGRLWPPGTGGQLTVQLQFSPSSPQGQRRSEEKPRLFVPSHPLSRLVSPSPFGHLTPSCSPCCFRWGGRDLERGGRPSEGAFYRDEASFGSRRETEW